MEEGFIPEVEKPESEIFPNTIEVKANYTFSDSLNYQVMDLKLEFFGRVRKPIDGEFFTEHFRYWSGGGTKSGKSAWAVLWIG